MDEEEFMDFDESEEEDYDFMDFDESEAPAAPSDYETLKIA